MTDDLIRRLRAEVPADLPDDWDVLVAAGDVRALCNALEALERTVAELEGLLREIRPQVDIVRGSWFDRTDAILARLDGKEAT